MPKRELIDREKVMEAFDAWRKKFDRQPQSPFSLRSALEALPAEAVWDSETEQGLVSARMTECHTLRIYPPTPDPVAAAAVALADEIVEADADLCMAGITLSELVEQSGNRLPGEMSRLLAAYRAAKEAQE